MISKVMLPLDGSAMAERALPIAQQVAAATTAEIHVLRVVEPLPIIPMPRTMGMDGTMAVAYVPSPVADEAWAAVTRSADDYLAAQRPHFSAVMPARVQTERLTGNVAVALLDYIRSAGIDLVVMCSHGRSGISRFALGSIADRLLRDGTAPVLLVRAFGEPVRLDQAVVCLDGSPRAEQALAMVTGLAPAVIREVTLLRVVGSQAEGLEAENYLDTAARTIPQDALTCSTRVEMGDAAERILAVSSPDRLVVLVTHGRSGLLRWAMGSVADRVTHGGPAGLLLLRAGA
jgi:nucleotide-binding universal stress UspA family protein